MNIYSKKQQWKLWLVVAAVLIVGTSLWYANLLVNKIAKEERIKVKLWAEAIQKKANLVKYTNELFNKIKVDERKKVELWAEATRQLSYELSDYGFVLKVVSDNTTVPVILADENGVPITSRNLDSTKENDKDYLLQQMKAMAAFQEPIEINIYKGQKNYLYYKDSKLFSELKSVLDDLVKSFISEVAINSASVPVIYTDSTKLKVIEYGPHIDSVKIKDPAFLKSTLAEMASQNQPIEVEFGDGNRSYIFYKESVLLTQLKYYPFIMLVVIGVFLLIAYVLFSTARRVEQNQVWVGMAKETAHQLGTPLSSLIAWLEYLKTKGLDSETAIEIEKDLSRLQMITERFSKIGSVPVLDYVDLVQVLNDAIGYMKLRTSKNVTFTFDDKGQSFSAQLNVPLFEWVIENLIRNAVDAMNGNGEVTITLQDQTQFVYIDITDTGKGIVKSKFKTVFEPGYTTKKRGWGLGLSLTKRIIENYHSGKIFVKSSDPQKGTTFRIVINK